MKLHRNLTALGTLLLLILASCSRSPETSETPDSPSGSLSLQKLVLALKPDKNPDKMLEERTRLSSLLQEKLGRPVEVIVPLTSSAILEGFLNGTVDIGYLSATDLINAEAQDSATLLLAGQINGNPWYESYWVSLKEKPYTSVEDLRGKPVAFSSKTSTSGYVIPHWDLVKKGLLAEGQAPEAFFGEGNVWYGTGYVSAVERVLNGEAEAAAVSYYVLDKDKHLTAEQRGKLKMMAKQGPVPTHVLALRKSIGPEDRALLLRTFLSFNQPDLVSLRDDLFASELVEADQTAHLAGLKEALKATASNK